MSHPRSKVELEDMTQKPRAPRANSMLCLKSLEYAN